VNGRVRRKSQQETEKAGNENQGENKLKETETKRMMHAGTCLERSGENSEHSVSQQLICTEVCLESHAAASSAVCERASLARIQALPQAAATAANTLPSLPATLPPLPPPAACCCASCALL